VPWIIAVTGRKIRKKLFMFFALFVVKILP